MRDYRTFLIKKTRLGNSGARTRNIANQLCEQKAGLLFHFCATRPENMELDPGWLVLYLFMLIEGFLVILMILPVPSNDARRFIRDKVAGLWDSKPIQYFSIAFLLLDAFYFWFVFNALLHPLHDFGILTPIDMAVTCEIKQAMYREERNAFISGMGLFLFFVLNRLVDIQDKLHLARNAAKQTHIREQKSKKNEEYKKDD
jgi:hypothetical protein